MQFTARNIFLRVNKQLWVRSTDITLVIVLFSAIGDSCFESGMFITYCQLLLSNVNLRSISSVLFFILRKTSLFDTYMH